MDIREELELEVSRLFEKLEVSPAPKAETFHNLSIPSSPDIDWG